MTNITLNPVHKSAKPKGGMKPRNMAIMEMSDEERVFIEKMALSIFADCSNAGRSFNECLTAILISGMDWGINASK